jgi:hypothetical protein
MVTRPRVLTPSDDSGCLRRMSQIYFVGGEKGGVGKSVLARLLAQWCVDRSAPFAAIDADASHGSLLRSYGEFTQPVDLDDFASADEIVNRALGAERTVVVDLPAQSGRALERWIESADVVRFAREAGIRLTLWHVSDGTFDSVRDLERTLDRWADAFKYVAVKNHGRGKDFGLFDESIARRRVEQMGGCVIELPALDSGAMARIDRSGASFWNAVHDADRAHALAPLQRERARIWLGRCFGIFGSVADTLGQKAGTSASNAQAEQLAANGSGH